MTDPTTDSRIRAVENSVQRIEGSLQRMLDIQDKLATLSEQIIELLSNNKHMGIRVEKIEENMSIHENVSHEVQVLLARLETKIEWQMRILAAAGGLAMAVLGWVLSKI